MFFNKRFNNRIVLGFSMLIWIMKIIQCIYAKLSFKELYQENALGYQADIELNFDLALTFSNIDIKITYFKCLLRN